MGILKATALLDDLIEKAGGCAVVDGGLATQLEKHGASINDPLWSALCLIKDPDLVKRVRHNPDLVCALLIFSNVASCNGELLECAQVHLEYLEAGADILVTSSYQVHYG